MATINTNMIDLLSRHALQRSQAALSKAIERLATGTRINRASDDPSGLIAAERLDARRQALESQIGRLEFDNHRLAAKEGAMSVLSDMAAELEGLTVAAANTGGLSDAEREALQVEADSIIDGMRHVVSTSTFNGQRLLDGYDPSSLGELKHLDESGSGETISYDLADLASGGALTLLGDDLELAQKVAKQAVSDLALARGAIGSQMQGNESTIRTSLAEFENTSAAYSEIMDTDFAAEISELTRAQILEQAGIASILLGQERRQMVLGLLGG